LKVDQIYAILTPIFRDIFDDDSIVLTSQTTAADIDGWDSVIHIDLMLTVESKFKIKFQTAEVESLHNVGHLVQVIQAKVG
jgi:acyl carrier protein